MTHREEIEPQEIFLDRMVRREEEKKAVAEKKIETPLSKQAVFLPFAAAAFIFLVFFLRVVQLQVMHGKDFSAQAESNKYLYYKIQADRGIIFDRSFKPLVENLSTFDLVCDSGIMPADPGRRTQITASLSKIINVSQDELSQRMDNPAEPVLKNLDHRLLIILEARIAEFPGCQISTRPIRKYTGDLSLSHALGYMGKIEQDEWAAQKDVYSIYDYVGRSGIEKSYEKMLRKNSGELRIERDSKGNVISRQVSAMPESGDSVVLWLDLELQKKIRESMEAQLKSLGLKKGAVVALDPKTGGVLALASFPEYDDNLFSGGKLEEINALFSDENNALFDRAIAGQYLCGSTIKPLTASAALQEKIISADKSIDCKGGLTIQDAYDPEKTWFIPDNHTHGPTDMRKALAESCNAYFQTIGGGYEKQPGLGPTRIKKYLELFGWGSMTGIDLPGEEKGFIPSPDWKKTYFSSKQDQVWSDGDTYNMAIGQGFLGITPLQVVSAYAAIANGGTLYQPQMAQKVIDEKRNVVEEFRPKTIRSGFIDAANLGVVREGMRQAVTGANSPLASSVTLNSLPVAAAAKTGTAQVRKDANGKDIMNSWVTVFAPYDDPQIVLMVMMEDVHEGQLAVLPVAKEVLQWYFSPKDQPQEQPAIPSAGPGAAMVPAQTTPAVVDQARIKEQLRQIQEQIDKIQNTDLPAALPKSR